MPCFTPLKGWRAPGGRVVFEGSEGWRDRPVTLRCGQCQACRLDRSRQWALRCVHEAQLHDRNSFLTLTYDQEHVPKDGSLRVRDWQLFAKRARKAFGPFRFFHAGEYGDTNYRPHLHALVFGLDWAHDRVAVQQTRHKVLYTSPSLTEAWGNGLVAIGPVNWQTAAYVARYCMKKAQANHQSYRRIDLETGEEYYVHPEYVTMSRRPGIGANWYRRYKSDVFPSDELIHDGKRHRVPKYYDQQLEKEDPDTFKRIQQKRRQHVENNHQNYTEQRIRVKEIIHTQKLQQLKRPI